MTSIKKEYLNRIEYLNEGYLHRTDGPAIEWYDGYKSWYLNDIKYTEDQFHQEVIKLKLKRLVNL